MQLVPIPPEWLHKTEAVWFPFLENIAKRSHEPVSALVERVVKREVHILLVWDGENATALIGVRTVGRGDELIGEIVWLTGKGRETWQHLLPELEKYLKYIGCVECRPICRPGWSRMLKQHGYKTTHYVMEKTL